MTIRKTTIALVAVVLGMGVLTATANAATRDTGTILVGAKSERAEVRIDETKAAHDTAPARK
jgi:hypothetical protein